MCQWAKFKSSARPLRRLSPGRALGCKFHQGWGTPPYRSLPGAGRRTKSWPPKISPYSHFECVNGRSSSPRPDPSDGLPQAGLLAASSTRGGVPHHIGPCLGQAVGPMSWPPKISPYSHFECVNGRSSSPRPDPSDGLPQAGLLAASSTRTKWSRNLQQATLLVAIQHLPTQAHRYNGYL